MNAKHIETHISRRDALESGLSSICESKFKEHPFLTLSVRKNLEWILCNYLAMSQAFPFLQAGAQKELIFDAMMCRDDIPRDYEITASIMNFLCWDETGGHHAVLKDGSAGLRNILETRERFHANILRKDLALIFKKEIKPNYSLITRQYLTALYGRLSALDSVKRVAAMVAFERHAAQMIESLWISLADLLKIEKSKLLYFKIHVGGDDPAEAYHVDMTFRMIEEIVTPASEAEFYSTFAESYALNFGWCKNLVDAQGVA